MQLALDILRAVADPTRLRILALLRAMELSVGELAQVLGQSQPRVSRHVKILADAGFANTQKDDGAHIQTLRLAIGAPSEDAVFAGSERSTLRRKFKQAEKAGARARIGTAADLLKVSRDTAKTHLRSIFAKTNVNRQSELIRISYATSPPVRAK